MLKHMWQIDVAWGMREGWMLQRERREFMSEAIPRKDQDR